MYANITLQGYILQDREFNAFLETYLKSIPFIQRQGVKALLDFKRIQTKESLFQFVRESVKYKTPYNNIIVNHLAYYLESVEFQKDRQEYQKYIKSRCFHTPTELKRLKRWNEYLTGEPIITENYLKRKKIRCEEDIEVLVGLKLYNRPDIEMDDNFINTIMKII